jgi:hypothetical protein
LEVTWGKMILKIKLILSSKALILEGQNWNVWKDHMKNCAPSIDCRNPNLGLMTKATACKGAGQEGSPRITSHAPRIVGECEEINPQTPNELPLWELESW